MSNFRELPNILIGTSGWSYDDWKGVFYPKNLSSKEFLYYYSEIFYTNEINTTFYQIPSTRLVEGWVRSTPRNFVFTAKIPKVITHDNKLDVDGSYSYLLKYLDVMNPLIESGKFLAFLIQLPPSFKKADHFDILKNFIDSWPEDYKRRGYYLVIEFRHNSWMDDAVFDYLKGKGLVYCSVIEPKLPPRMDITNNEFFYIRFHGFGKKIWFDYLFSEAEIRDWAEKLRAVINKVKMAGIYFNNHFSGYAVKNALMMMRELRLKPKKDPGEINIINIKKKSGTVSRGQMSLDQFF